MTKLKKETIEANGIDVGLDEVFNQIPQWNKYFYSNYGRLIHRSKSGKLNIVKPSITKEGYFTYTLYKSSRTYKGEKVRDKHGNVKVYKKCKPAHQLCAIMYCSNPYDMTEYSIEDLHVHHKDKNRKNNYYKNLMFLSNWHTDRDDHSFIHTIREIALYDEITGKFHGYSDIELLANRLDVDILELIDCLKQDCATIEKNWNVYRINNKFIGVQFHNNLEVKAS